MNTIGTEPFHIDQTEIVPLHLRHGSLDVLGFRIGSIAYCTDCNLIPPDAMSKLKGLDVLVLDALRYSPHPTHFTLDEAIDVASAIGARRTYLTHIAHDIKHEDVEPALPAGIHLAYDGLRVTSWNSSTLL